MVEVAGALENPNNLDFLGADSIKNHMLAEPWHHQDPSILQEWVAKIGYPA